MHMPEKYLLHNLYKCSLTIITIISVNDLRLEISSVNFICYNKVWHKHQILFGYSLISDIQRRNFWKNKNVASNFLGCSTLKTLNAACSNSNAWKNHLLQLQHFLLQQNKGCSFLYHIRRVFSTKSFFALDTWLNGRLKNWKLVFS